MGRKTTSKFVIQVTAHLTEEEKQKLDYVFGRLQIDFKLSMNEKLRRLIIAAYQKGLRA